MSNICVYRDIKDYLI